VGPRAGLDVRKISSPPVFFLLYLILHCHYITIVGSLLVPLSNVTVYAYIFDLSNVLCHRS